MLKKTACPKYHLICVAHRAAAVALRSFEFQIPDSATYLYSEVTQSNPSFPVKHSVKLGAELGLS